jgi:hypothetical protein
MSLWLQGRLIFTKMPADRMCYESIEASLPAVAKSKPKEPAETPAVRELGYWRKEIK